jgi:hypothetical protein
MNACVLALWRFPLPRLGSRVDKPGLAKSAWAYADPFLLLNERSLLRLPMGEAGYNQKLIK